MSGEFNAPYHFRQNATVVLKHHHGKFIRVHPENLNDADGHGGVGEYARWLCELDGDFIKLKNQYTQKYLRIWKNGEDVDVDGGGGPFTLFKIHVVESPNIVKLESERFVGRFIGVNEHGKVTVSDGGQNCVVTFFREGDGLSQLEQVKQLKQEDYQKQDYQKQDYQKQDYQKQQQFSFQSQQQQSQQSQQSSMQNFQQFEQKVNENNLSEEGRIVKTWLDSIKMSDYLSVFMRNGFDRLSSIGVITESDLEKMNVALGHRKVLLAAAHLAPYEGKKIALRSMNYNTYVSGSKVSHGKDAHTDLGAHKDLQEECVWLCTQIGEGKMTLANVKHGGYLRVPKIIDKEACTQHELDDRCELQFVLAANHPGHMAIFCPNNGNYLSCKEPNLLGHTELVARPNIGKQECFTIIIRP